MAHTSRPHLSRWAVQAEFAAMLKDYVGRESPLYHADRLSEHYRRSAVLGSPWNLQLPAGCTLGLLHTVPQPTA